MATFRSSSHVEECDICAELMKNPRALDCGHQFCLNCLETLETDKMIHCPMCRAKTSIPVGLKVSHLPKKMPKASGKVTRSNLCSLEITKSINLKKCVSAIQFDEENQIIVVGFENGHKPCMFSLMGTRLAELPCNDLRNQRITIDTKRHLYIVGSDGCDTLKLFNDDGENAGGINHKCLKRLEDLAYCRASDEIIIADSKRHQLLFMSMPTEKITRAVLAEECRWIEGHFRNVHVASSKRVSVPLIATIDSEGARINLYNKDGDYIRSFGDGCGTGYGKLNHPYGLCFDYEGRILVSDTRNKRIVRIDPDVEDSRNWETIFDFVGREMGFPQNIEVTADGIVIVAMQKVHTEEKTLFSIVIFRGYA